MKKIMKYIFVAAIVLIASNSFAQKFYLKLNGGYNWGTASFNERNVTQINNNSYRYESVQVALGKGVNLGGSVGYMFNKYIGAELGINYLIGDSTNVSKKTTYEPETTNHSATMISFVPAIIFTPGYKKLNPYARFGLIVGYGNYETKKDWESSFGKVNLTKLYNGGIALGLNAALGVTFTLKEHFSLFGEINTTNLSYAPTKSEITEYKINGVDDLSNKPNSFKYTDYVESYTRVSNVPFDDNVAGKDLIKNYPFNSVGLNIGVKYRF